MRQLALSFAVVVFCVLSPYVHAFEHFITARDGRLFEGAQPFRFLSFNIPNLTYTEDDMRFTQVNSFRWPTAYEIDDALGTIKQMGGRVVRSYVLSVAKTNDSVGMPVTSLGRAS